MDDFKFYHEEKVVELRAVRPLNKSSLHKFLIASGFKSEDEFYFIDRIEKAKPWQSISVMTIEPFLGERKLEDDNETLDKLQAISWDRLKAYYFLASLPSCYIFDFCDRVFSLSEEFQLKVIHNGDEVDKNTLLKDLNKCAQELSENYSEPGSEALGVLIQCSYPR